MQPELAPKAISRTVIGISLIGFLFVLLVSLRKELSSGEPLRGVFHLGLAIQPSGFLTMPAQFEPWSARKKGVHCGSIFKKPGIISKRIIEAMGFPRVEKMCVAKWS
jgi:hypothetical protein